MALVTIDEDDVSLCFLNPRTWDYFYCKSRVMLRNRINSCKLWEQDIFPTYYGPDNQPIPYGGRVIKPVIDVPPEHRARPRKGDSVEFGDGPGGWICYIADGEAFVRTVADPVPEPYSLDDFFDYTSKGRRTIWRL